MGKFQTGLQTTLTTQDYLHYFRTEDKKGKFTDKQSQRRLQEDIIDKNTSGRSITLLN